MGGSQETRSPVGGVIDAFKAPSQTRDCVLDDLLLLTAGRWCLLLTLLLTALPVLQTAAECFSVNPHSTPRGAGFCCDGRFRGELMEAQRR